MSFLTPRRYVRSVDVIDLDELYASGKRAILLDRDNTIVPRDTKEAPASALAWVERAKQRGFKMCLISNNYRKNVIDDANALGCELITMAMKPFPFAFLKGLGKLHVSRREAVVVGDQLFTDVLGAKLAGIDVILVEPQTEVDLAHTLVLRKLERVFLKGLVPEGSEN